jgi:hypothetical protein
LEACGSTIVGDKVIVNQGAVVRPSQLIASVRHLKKKRDGAMVRSLPWLLCLTAFGCVQQRTPGVAPGDVQQEVTELADAAVLDAKAEGTALDYSVESVQAVERVLAKYYEAGLLSEDQRIRIGTKYGAYVGEVARRKWGGYWKRDHPQAGADSYPLRSRELDMFPMTWCVKRLAYGPSDNVWNKFRRAFMGEGPGELHEYPAPRGSGE